jgi:diguanylate cyclase (GGDEF)-like protein/PAS domain S-box-containing protein
MNGTPPITNRTFAAQWLLLLATLLALGGMMAWNLYSEHSAIDATERARLSNQAEIIDKNLGFQLFAISHALDAVRDDLVFLKSQKDSSTLIERRLKSMRDAMPGVQTMFVLDADGTSIASSNSTIVGQSFSQREHFLAARKNNDPESLHVSPPFKTSFGVISLSLSKAIVGNDGQFSGMIAAIVDPDYFNTLLDSVRYTPDVWSSLAHSDGQLFLMMPHRPEIQGMSLDKPGSFRNRHLESQQIATVMTGTVYATGEDRMLALRTIQPSNVRLDKTLHVGVARDLKIIFSTWRKSAFRQGGLFGLVVLTASSGLFFYQRRRKAYDRVIAIQVQERQETEARNAIAATAFEAQQGMSITDAHGTILQVNASLAKLTGYAAEELVGKTPRILKSGRQDAAFYAAMWKSILSVGSWQGEVWNRHKNGEIYPAWLNISAVKNAECAITHFVGAWTDLGAHKAAEQRIENLAFYDPLTGLPNRALLMDRLAHALESARRLHHKGAVMLIDLDNFKTLNDTLGHEQGDRLIQQVAPRLRSFIRGSDTVARIGGDKFIVLLEDLTQDSEDVANQAKAQGDQILELLRQSYVFEGSTHHSSASIGIVLFDGTHDETIDDLLKQVDLAMYQAKAAGRDTLRFFDPQMQAAVNNRAGLESRLREAVADNNFLLHYQLQIDGDQRITGAEALVRWLDPKRGMISPAEFIPIAEETGLILPIGQWVLETACNQLASWTQQPATGHLTVAVNVSARQFRQKDFVAQVIDTIRRTGANPNRLKLEITESMLVDDINGIIAKMEALKSKGVRFSIDDFGTGYSSLAYLKRLPLDQLKIDQGFVRDILVDPNDAAIAKMVIALADSMGLAVIAEGVETEQQREFLAKLGCHAYQGYLFSRPLPVNEFETLINRNEMQFGSFVRST